MHPGAEAVGVVPDGSTVAETFDGVDLSEAAGWLARHNRAGRNIYFTANSTPAGLRRKPSKDDVEAINAMWADVDPLDGNGRPWAAERERLIALAAELQALETPPTFIVDSGNGVQPVWLLEDPIDASEEYRRAAEVLCTRIEAALGAKGTHNIDRLLRVPGSRNYPNEKKRKLGRGETRARLLDATWRRYSWRDIDELAARLEARSPEHAVPVPPSTHSSTAEADDLDLPESPPEALDDASLEAMRANTPDVFDLARYDGDQSRQDLALASLACRAGWEPVDVWRLLIAVRDDRKAYRRDYIERTIQRAQDSFTGDYPAAEFLSKLNGDAESTSEGDSVFDLSHDGLALDMGRLWQRDSRHVAMWGRWLFWNGARWEPDEKLAHMTRSRDYLRNRADSLVRGVQEGKIQLDDDDEKALAKAEAIAKSLRTKQMVASVVDLARGNRELVGTVAQWDSDPFLLGTPDGTVDLRTGELRPAKASDYITKCTAVAPATSGTPAPIWQTFLERYRTY